MTRPAQPDRFLVVTADPTPHLRAAAASAGALACLAKPIDPWALVDFLRHRTAPTRAPQRHLRAVLDVEDLHVEDLHVEDLHQDDVDPDTMNRLQQMYASALPHRLSMITDAARAGNAIAVASAAQTLAGASGQLGHREIASVCQRIASDARRGIVTGHRLRKLMLLGLGVPGASRSATGTLPAVG